MTRTAVASDDGDEFEVSSRLLHEAALRAAEGLSEFARVAQGQVATTEPVVTVNLHIDGAELVATITAAIRDGRRLG